MSTVHLVTSDAELEAAFATAVDGDRIELASDGVFETPELRSGHFDSGVTVTSEDPDNPATITTRLHVQGVSNVTISDITVARDALATSGTEGTLTLNYTTNVTLQNIGVSGHIPSEAEGKDPEDTGTARYNVIAGYGYGFGVRVLNSTGLEVEGLEVSDVRIALRVEKSSALTLSELDIHDVREGINFFGISGMAIEDSRFHDFAPWWFGKAKIHDHPDMIQFWGSNGGIEDIVITRNIFDQADGWTQTILGGMSGTPGGSPRSGMEISDNIIVNGHQNGLYINGLDDVTIANNLLIPNTEDASGNIDYPQVLLYNSNASQITGNVAVARSSGSITNVSIDTQLGNDILVDGNLALSRDSGAEDYWGPLLEAWRAGTGEIAPRSDNIVTDAEALLGLDEAPGPDPVPDLAPRPDPVPDLPSAQLEIGTLEVAQDDPDAWHSVSFDETIEQARVVMGPLTDNDSQAATLRVRNVTDTGFEFQIDEWDYQDGLHGTETVSWIAVSEGSYTLELGQTISAGRTSMRDETATEIDLDAHDSAPAVFAQVTSHNGSQGVITRVSSVDAADFTVRMQEQENSDHKHVAETLDWIAIDYGTDVFDLGRVDDSPTALDADLADMALIAGMQTARGRDTATLRLATGDGAPSIYVEEETSLDKELAHTAEDVALMALTAGSYDLI